MYGNIYSRITSSGMSTAGDGDNGDDDGRVAATDEMDSSAEISGSCVFCFEIHVFAHNLKQSPTEKLT